MSSRCGKGVDVFVVEYMKTNRISTGGFGLNQWMHNDRQGLHQSGIPAAELLRNEMPDELFTQRLFPRHRDQGHEECRYDGNHPLVEQTGCDNHHQHRHGRPFGSGASRRGMMEMDRKMRGDATDLRQYRMVGNHHRFNRFVPIFKTNGFPPIGPLRLSHGVVGPASREACRGDKFQ